jgi:cyclase
MTGYDLSLIRQVTDAVSVPIIVSGGAGNYEHMLQAIRDGKASAVAAASMFTFTEQSRWKQNDISSMPGSTSVSKGVLSEHSHTSAA